MTLGENIVRLRTQKNWSQGDLADALDISRQSVSKWETDASIPELDKLLKLSELFGVTLDELVRGEEVPKTETAMPTAQTVPASFAPQAAPGREKHHTIAGTVLLCTGAVILIFCLLLAGDLLAGLLFASPFLICGIICFAVKRRVGLCCGWAVYLCIDLYLRFATGLSWTTIFMTPLWTYEMNYMRLAIAWMQFFAMLVMIVCTVRSYRTLKLSATKKEVTWLIAGWLAALVVLPLLMRYGVEGVHYEMRDGKPYSLLGQGSDGSTVRIRDIDGSATIKALVNYDNLYVDDQTLYKDFITQMKAEYHRYAYVSKNYNNYLPSGGKGIDVMQLEDFAIDTIIRLISESGDFDAEWEEFKRQYNEKGGNKIAQYLTENN